MPIPTNRKRVIAIGIAVALLLFFVATWFVGGKLVAPANREVGDSPLLDCEQYSISSESGSELAAWYFPARIDESKATILLLHPVRADRRAMQGRTQLLQENGYATVLIDLQAHGESAGDAITFGYRERLDVRAAVDWARAKNPDHKIGIVGWSLGGAAALLASPLDIDALVLESVYPTIEEAVHNRIKPKLGPLHHVLAPTLLMQLKPRLGIDPKSLRPIDHAKEVQCPVLLLCGDKDHHTTIEESKRLLSAFREPKRLVVFEDAAHVDLLSHDSALYTEAVSDFFSDHLWNH